MKSHLCECLHVDDVDQPEKEGKSVLHSGHVGQQAAFRKYLHHWWKYNKVIAYGFYGLCPQNTHVQYVVPYWSVSDKLMWV